MCSRASDVVEIVGPVSAAMWHVTALVIGLNHASDASICQ